MLVWSLKENKMGQIWRRNLPKAQSVDIMENYGCFLENIKSENPFFNLLVQVVIAWS
jgi:hypothetical protein